MLPTPDADKISWEPLLAAFQTFKPDAEWLGFNPHAFEAALLIPPLPFVEALLKRRSSQENEDGHPARVRALYAFLLERRYEEKLNLLYFAFDVWDDTSPLPSEVIARTPFPHEDGLPAFRYAV
ncbi:hypothetical protein [Desulfosoma caldarium]|uniref:Uncharacterized protein n=1 Tax=Desulfosoma caldarium TaxID=610254 RepID=A0A3N1UPH1_9BACT|nr:hypothetical protein [Desulfosoma caldarium]ROQ89781.1 hypothetical protein EDC27_2892 [Desulfosoma caldarium]